MAPNLATAPYEEMSPSLLAAQPPTAAPLKHAFMSVSAWQTLFGHLESRLGALRSWRWSFWVYWRVLAEFFLPRRYIWLAVANRMWRGSPINDAIIDSTGLLAVRTCASGMWTGLTSPSRPWFKLGIALPWIQLDADGKAWLEDTEQRLYAVLHQSNFYNMMAQAFQDTTVFGTAPLIIYEDAEDVIRLYLPCAGEYYLQVGSRLNVTVLNREFTLTVAQIVEQFTLERCPPDVASMWATGGGSLDTEFVVCHSIEPNFDLQSKRGGKSKVQVVPPHFVYRETYWLKGVKADQPLSLKGFVMQPFFTLRWSTVSNDAYGRSPCMDALGDNKQVQLETRRKAEFIEKGVRPPMGADPILKNEPASIMPGQITYFPTDGSPRKGFFPLFEPNAQWLGALTQDIDKVNSRIERCLYVDLFMAITRMEGVQPRNQLELTKRDLERLQELGPVIDLAEGELSIAIRRVLDIMVRRNMLKPKPKSLDNVPLKINYTSILRLAQRAAESVAMKDTLQTAGQLSLAAKNAGVPDPLRILDLDKSMRHYADLNGYPADCLYTEDEVKQHDQIRAEENQKAAVPAEGLAAVDAAKTLSDTQLPGGNTALGAMLGATPQ